ncbi:Cyanovirin-N [Terfezia boudieri ATCC MYA-4762]|uniref:Cyanovirin-N n=1 Tax=Terfezia boudieri ATCC MYA-4762 TaxID=1051890 RepID=A0A3N4LF54_9PEZI|nr:Cyanovirin-N [Terfezia boudieri ATCC MYA-4762]
MSFHASSQGISLHDNHILVAQVKSEHGTWHHRTIDLNNYIGNSDGWFIWGGQKFSHSARNISLSHRPDGVWLEGELRCVNGGYRERQGINLSEKISNQGGNLVL